MSDIHDRTRKIYEAQHERISNDEAAFKRNLEMYGNDSFGIEKEWFRGKSVLDAGCGNIGSPLIRLASFGVDKLVGSDLGSAWIEKLKANLQSHGVDLAKVELVPGSVLELPFADGSFDFTSINGVLIHLADMNEIEKGFAEGCRVTKPGGYFYTSYGPCGGVMQGVIFPALRKHYAENESFKKFIDGLSPAVLHSVFDKMNASSVKNGGEDLNSTFLKSLFGEDFCMFLHNFIQAPTWYSNECTPAYVESLYAKQGFKDVRRLKKFIKRQDIRKYFAPIHFETEWEISKVLYGEGYPIYIGHKPA